MFRVWSMHGEDTRQERSSTIDKRLDGFHEKVGLEERGNFGTWENE